MGQVGLIAAYVAGGLMLGVGIFLVLSGHIPEWTREWMLRPIDLVTPTVGRLLGAVAIGLGGSVLALVVSTLVSEFTGVILVLAAIVAYLLAVALFAYTTWLSRRLANSEA
jgi:hypothetical protein